MTGSTVPLGCALKKKILPMLLVAILLPAGWAVAQSGAGEAPAVTVYPSFHLKFSREGGNYLVASMVILNISGYSVQNLTLTQEFP